jgi:DNA polymerase III subunit delta'
VPFDTIEGQPAAVGILTRALRSGHLHHALRFEGPAGVGKRLTAMALAQALVCSGGDALGCGQCSACHRAVTLSEGPPSVPLHPDVIFVERGLYPPEVIGRHRAEVQDISVDQVRSVILGRANFPPHEGRARVFIVHRADEMSISAANSLLKTLEEPGRGTYFVLLTSRAAKLPDTVRSRSFRIRFSPLPDAIVLKILESRGVEHERAVEATALAAGSASVALELVDPEASKLRHNFVESALKAIGAPDLVPSLDLAEARTSDKRQLRENLEALAARLARAARSEALRNGPRAQSLALRYQVVLRAIRELDRNASPALMIESMLLRLRAVAG